MLNHPNAENKYSKYCIKEMRYTGSSVVTTVGREAHTDELCYGHRDSPFAVRNVNTDALRMLLFMFCQVPNIKTPLSTLSLARFRAPYWHWANKASRTRRWGKQLTLLRGTPIADVTALLVFFSWKVAEYLPRRNPLHAVLRSRR